MADPRENAVEQHLIRIEEQAAFVERAVEQLSHETANINSRLQSLTKRIQAIEHRLGRIIAPDGDQPGGDSNDRPVIS
jgi:prefoldin subunit 5